MRTCMRDNFTVWNITGGQMDVLRHEIAGDHKDVVQRLVLQTALKVLRFGCHVAEAVFHNN